MNKCCSTIFAIIIIFFIHSVCFSQNLAETKKGFVSSGSFELEALRWSKTFYVSGNKSFITGTIRGKWKLWPLLNEPVEYSVAAWDLSSVGILDENGEFKIYYPCREGKPCSDENMIPWKVMKQVQIYDLKIRCRVKSENRKTLAVYIADPGVMASPGLTGTKNIKGKSSFNAPGSPSWNKLFLYHNPDGGVIPTDTFYRDKKDGEYYARQEYAKRLVKNGVDLIVPEIAAIKTDVFSVKLWIDKREREKREKKLRKQHEKQMAELNRKKQTEEREADSISAVKSTTRRPAERSEADTLLNDFEQELLSKNDRQNTNGKKNQSTDNFLEDAFAEQLDNQLFKVELKRKYKALSLDLEKKHLAEKQELNDLFEKRHMKLLNDKKTVEKAILAKRGKINSYVLPEEELIPFYQSSEGYGYKNSAGKIAIPPQYITAHRFEIFNEKYAFVQNDTDHCNGPAGLNNYLIIDRKGKQVTPEFIYNRFPTKNRIEISILKSFKKPRKVYANKARNNLRNKYLEWEYQTEMQLEIITFDSKFNRISRKTESINDNGNWFWMEKCFDITSPDGYK